METILIMARALEKSSGADVERLDIQHNEINDTYYGHLHLVKMDSEGNLLVALKYHISENGSVMKED